MITSFRGEFEFLSNFSPSEVEFEGMKFSTVEHGFQSAKTLDLTERKLIQESTTPGKSKRLGRKVTLRPDWEEIKIEVMETLLRQKFSIPELKEKLLSTGTQTLVEGNGWGDTFWGVCEGVGRNELGKLLMKIRGEV